MLKILQVNKFYHPVVGGVERVLYDLSRRLALKAEVSVLACQPRGWGVFERANNVQIRRCTSLGTFYSMPLSPTFPFHLRRALSRADVVHFHLPFPLGDFSSLLTRARPKTVVTWHSDIVRQRWFLRFYRPFLERFLERVHRVIATSSEALENSSFLRPYRSKCQVIPLGVDFDRLRLTPQIETVARKIRDRYGEPLVLFVGRLAYYKGLRDLLLAMQSVSARLLIVGDGPLRPELVQLAKELRLTDRISFVGLCPVIVLPAYYHACDLLVLPSVEHTEAFGLVQVEAMACGKPLVTTDLPTGARFVNVDGATGLRVPPRDPPKLGEAISRLLADRQLREVMGKNAHERAHQLFHVDTMVSRYFEVYESLAAQRGTESL